MGKRKASKSLELILKPCGMLWDKVLQLIE